MNTRIVVLASLLAVPGLVAQDAIKPGQARGFASEVRASAAQAQFNSIRLQMVLMFKDLYAKHPLQGASAEEKAMINDAEDEILRLIAAQLSDLMETYEGVDIVETAARAVLARIQTKLGDFDGAIATLEEFDAEAAEGNTLLEAVLASAVLDNVRDPRDLLTLYVDEAPNPDMAFDAVMIATRLGMGGVAGDLYKQTRQRFFESNEGVDGEAEFLLAEANFVVRVGIVRAIAVNEEAPEGGFNMDPVNKATMGMVIPGSRWSAYATNDSYRDEGPQSTAVANASSNTSNPGSSAFGHEDRMQADFVTSPVFLKIVKDSLPGLQSMDAWHSLDSFANSDSMGNGNSVSYINGAIIRIEEAIADAAANGDSTGISPASARGTGSENNTEFADADDIFQITVAGLLHRVAFMYPGTDAADTAGAQIDADQFSFGDRAIPFSAPTTDGGLFFLGKYSDKAVLIEFSSLHDEDSMADKAAVNDIARIYGPNGLHVVRVFLNSAEDEWLLGMSGDNGANDFVSEIYEGKGNHSDIAKLYGVTAAPTRILICTGMRVFEADQAKLTSDKLHDSIQNCLQFNHTEPGSGINPVGSKADAYFSDPETQTYTGPVFKNHLEVLESLPQQYVLNAEATVPNDGYQLIHDRTKTVNNVTEVYLTLRAPEADQVPGNFNDVDVRVQLGNSIGNALRVYVRHVIADQFGGDEEDGYQLDDVISGPSQNRNAYYGPALDVEITGTDGPLEELTAAIAVVVPSTGYNFSFDGTRQDEDKTQILLSLTRPSSNSNPATGGGEPTGPINDAFDSEASRAETKRVVVSLGSEVSGNIEVLVSFREAGTPPADDYALASVLNRN